MTPRTPQTARAPRWIPLSLIALVACNGDDGGRMDSATGTTTATATATASASMTQGTDSSQSDSASTSSDAGSETNSAGVTSNSGSTGMSTSMSTTSEETTATTTGGQIPYCGDDPPKGSMGMVNQECVIEPKVGMFNPIVEWQKTAWAAAPAYNQVMMAPIVASITDDNNDGKIDDKDMPDVLYVTYAGSDYQGVGVLRAISGDGQTEILSISDQSVAACSGLAAGDIDGDGVVEIIAVAAGGVIKCFEHDGTLKWASPSVAGHMVYPFMAAPAIADMDGDGKPEVIAGRAILNNDGTLRGAGQYGTGAPVYGSASFAADVDGDGIQELVVGNALYTPDGATIWTNQQPDGYPAVADFDKDGTPEIAVVSAGTVRLQTAAGGVLWNVANPAGVGGPPTIADYDGDGAPEIGVAGKAGYVVFDGDGTILWQNPTQDASSAITGSSVYDFEGDGVADVVYADEVNLYVYSGIDGAVKLLYDGHNSGTLIEYPIVVDVDNDGQVEIVVVHNNLIQTAYGVTVLGDMDKSWRPGRKIWNQHAYNITNVNDDGTIPAKPNPNWATYNNFRSGDLSAADGLEAPDLVVITPDSCLNECTGADSVNVWIQLGNLGVAPLTAGVTIEIYATTMGVETLLDTIPVDIILQPGEIADAFPIMINAPGADKIRISAKPNEAECIVDPANEIVLEAPFCTIPG
ncbi:MAG: VCBS repeat-containing protein [Nannocystaceae bacterium]